MQIPPSGASAFGRERSVQEMELNILMYLAVILVAGLLFGRLAKFVKLPNVTGYLVAGLVIGPCVLKILPETIVSDFSLISEMALAFIAFTVGLTFKRSYFKRVGFTPVVIAIFEAMVAVFLVQGALVAFGFDVEFALVLGAIAAFGIGNIAQVHSIADSVKSVAVAFNENAASRETMICLITGICVPIFVALVLLGGVKRIGSVTEKLVPFMALFYVVLALGVVVINYRRFPAVLASIVGGAFDPQAFTGGAIGSIFLSMQKGVSRGIFSNEAGLGTGSIAHACADTRKPVKQGMFGIFEVFADTIVICTLTAMVILCSGVPVGYGSAAGAELTISGFTATYGGWSSIFTAVALCSFAFSTIIGWGLYGSRCIEFLFHTDKVVGPFLVVYSFVSILGATVDLGLLWSIADTFNGLMSIPNLMALLLLSGTVAKLTKEFFAGEGAGK